MSDKRLRRTLHVVQMKRTFKETGRVRLALIPETLLTEEKNLSHPKKLKGLEGSNTHR